jgi:hypothetical protein
VSLSDGTTVELEVSNDARIHEIVRSLCLKVAIKSHQDFRLVMMDSNKHQKILQDEEVFESLYKLENRSQDSKITLLLNKINAFLLEKQTSSFSLKKVIYLSPEQEDLAYANDDIRLRLVVN